MEKQPQNSEFRNNLENFHPCNIPGINIWQSLKTEIFFFLFYILPDPLSSIIGRCTLNTLGWSIGV